MEDRDGSCDSLTFDNPLTALRSGDIFDHPLRMPIGLMCTCLWVEFFCNDADENRINVGYVVNSTVRSAQIGKDKEIMFAWQG